MWEYVLFIVMEGDNEDTNVATGLQELVDESRVSKVWGSYAVSVL